MPGGKTNTQRIETLESQAANMMARLDVHDTLLEGLKAVLDKGTKATEGHTSKISIIEQTLVMVNLKDMQAAIGAIEKEHLGLRKDLEALQKWKDELKKEKEEITRRWWSFGPNITAAIISGIVALAGIGINLAVNYYLRKR
jgi:chromosome segregation ATPase